MLVPEGIYPDNTVIESTEPKKLYLKVNNDNTFNLGKCNSVNGLLELCEESEVSKNCVFKLSNVDKKVFVKESTPFKYIDFTNSHEDPNVKKTVVESEFFNLQLYSSKNSVTYCAEGCEKEDMFCAQEDTSSHLYAKNNGYTYERKPVNSMSTANSMSDANSMSTANLMSATNLMSTANLKSATNPMERTVTPMGVIYNSTPISDPASTFDPKAKANLIKYSLTDKHKIKNYIKFKIEDTKTMLVTPYFLSKNPIEQIYFFTNKYNILKKPNNYKKIIQVPIYQDPNDLAGSQKPYYETPVYRNNALTYEKTLITGLNDHYDDHVISSFKDRLSMKNVETLAFKNSAYEFYSLQFYFEPIMNSEINALPN
jgi:hypothetical protein